MAGRGASIQDPSRGSGLGVGAWPSWERQGRTGGAAEPGLATNIGTVSQPHSHMCHHEHTKDCSCCTFNNRDVKLGRTVLYGEKRPQGCRGSHPLDWEQRFPQTQQRLYEFSKREAVCSCNEDASQTNTRDLFLHTFVCHPLCTG